MIRALVLGILKGAIVLWLAALAVTTLVILAGLVLHQIELRARRRHLDRLLRSVGK